MIATSAKTEVRVGVIGLGFMGSTHLGAYIAAQQAGFPCTLVAVADHQPSRRAGQLSDVGGNISTGSQKPAFDPSLVRAYASAEELLADPAIDLVSICTPTDSHADLAIKALRAGKHVLVEKPVALAVSEIQRVRDAQQASGRHCMPAMCMRFWPGWGSLLELIEHETLGACTGLVLQRLGAAPSWSQGFYDNPSRSGGALVDLHIHDADFVRFCFGSPSSVSSVGSIGHLTTQYRFDKGPKLVSAEGGWLSPGFGFRMRYVATFEQGTVDFDISREQQCLLTKDRQTTAMSLEPLSGYDLEIRYIVDCIAIGKNPEAATLDDAIAVARILDAERESIKTGKPVPVL